MGRDIQTSLLWATLGGCCKVQFSSDYQSHCVLLIGNKINTVDQRFRIILVVLKNDCVLGKENYNVKLTP